MTRPQMQWLTRTCHYCVVQLLQKFTIRATNGPEKLLSVIKNPITDHLPSDCRKIRLTETAKQCTDVGDFVTTLPPDRPVVFVIGAFAKGKLDVDFVDTVRFCR